MRDLVEAVLLQSRLDLVPRQTAASGVEPRESGLGRALGELSEEPGRNLLVTAQISAIQDMSCFDIHCSCLVVSSDDPDADSKTQQSVPAAQAFVRRRVSGSRSGERGELGGAM